MKAIAKFVAGAMDVIYRCCADLDVHKQTVEGAVWRMEPDGRVQVEIRQFGTMTDDLLEMVEWLKAQGVTPRGDGIDRCVLEADLQHLGGTLHRTAGERPPCQASARA